uniref:Uncharacterized protein n=1 Tax=Spironucleus salmonicida TaxID=348837 RepID=V6LZF8_9EUKA|eukprot:EST46204.1 Hypothetical protein SS50377_13799 [Spironucleus salmonicida]
MDPEESIYFTEIDILAQKAQVFQQILLYEKSIQGVEKLTALLLKAQKYSNNSVLFTELKRFFSPYEQKDMSQSSRNTGKQSNFIQKINQLYNKIGDRQRLVLDKYSNNKQDSLNLDSSQLTIIDLSNNVDYQQKLTFSKLQFKKLQDYMQQTCEEHGFDLRKDISTNIVDMLQYYFILICKLKSQIHSLEKSNQQILLQKLSIENELKWSKHCQETNFIPSNSEFFKQQQQLAETTAALTTEKAQLQEQLAETTAAMHTEKAQLQEQLAETTAALTTEKAQLQEQLAETTAALHTEKAQLQEQLAETTAAMHTEKAQLQEQLAETTAALAYREGTAPGTAGGNYRSTYN